MGDGDGRVLTLGPCDPSSARCWLSLLALSGLQSISLHCFPVEQGGYRWPVTPRGRLRYVPLGFSSLCVVFGPFLCCGRSSLRSFSVERAVIDRRGGHVAFEVAYLAFFFLSPLLLVSPGLWASSSSPSHSSGSAHLVS